MALPAKRTAYKALMANSETIGTSQSIVSVFCRNLSEGKTKKNTPFYRISCVLLNKSNIFVKARKPNGELDASDSPSAKKMRTEEDSQEEGHKGTVLKPGDQFMAMCYDKGSATLAACTLMKLAITCDWYIDHYTFQVSRIIDDGSSSKSAMTVQVYEKSVLDTPLAEIPTVDNLSESDFPEGTDEKYIARNFILPVSLKGGESLCSEVIIQLDETDAGRFSCRVKDDPEEYVGVNSELEAGKTSNMMTVVYTLLREPEKKYVMKFAYSPDTWRIFGVTNVRNWAAAGARMIFNACEWYAYGYSQLAKIRAIKANREGGYDAIEGVGECVYSTGFVVKMDVNLCATVRAAGVELSFDYLKDDFAKTFDNELENLTHPVNLGWKVKVRRGSPAVLNLSEFTTDQLDVFIKEVQNKSDIKFYGIFDTCSDEAYECESMSLAEREQIFREKNLRPSMIFAVM